MHPRNLVSRSAAALLVAGALLVATLTSGADAADRGVFVRNADRLTTALSAGDLDAFTVDVGETGNVTVKVKAAKGSTLLPAFRVFRPDGAEVDVSALIKKPGTAKPQLKKLIVPAGQTGTWEVRLDDPSGGTGEYTAQFKIKTPTKAVQKGVLVPAGGTRTVEFTADEGALLTAKIKEKSGPALAALRVLTPGGDEVAGSAAAFTRKGSTLSLKKFLLDLAGGGFGRYQVELTGDPAGDTTIDFSGKVKFAKTAKRKETLPPEASAAGAAPGSVRQEDTAAVIQISGADFLDGTVAVVGGAGVTVTGVDVLDAGSANVTMTVAADAPFGLRSVTLVPPPLFGEAFVLTDAFAVNAPDPAVSGFDPTSLTQGDLDVGIELSGTGFRADGAVMISGDGVTAGPVEFISPELVRATLSAADDAEASLRSVRYQQPGAGGGAIGTAPVQLRIFNPVPELDSVSPSVLRQGASGTVVTLTGNHFRDSATVTLGQGITFVGGSQVSNTEFRATVNVASDADVGMRDVVYRQPSAGGGSSVTLADALSVEAPVPVVSSSSPTFVTQGDSAVTVTITGSGFRTGGTLSVSGAGLALGATTVVNETTARVDFDVASDAAPGTRNVTFTQPASVGGAAGTGVSVMQVHAPAPTVSTVAPGSDDQGATGTMTLTGTNFTAGGTVSASGAGITFSGATRVSATEFRVDYAIAVTAATGLRDITFTQDPEEGGGGATKSSAFEVLDAGVLLTSVSPSEWLPGDTRTTVVLKGDQYNAGTTVAISGSGITLHSTSVDASDQITLVVSVASNASITQRDVTITPGAGGMPQKVFADRVTVVPGDPTVTGFSAAALARGASSVDVSIAGTNFRSGDSVSISGSGVSAASTSVKSSHEITTKISVTAGAALGARDVTISHSGSEGGRSGKLAKAFDVIAATPSVSSVNPSNVARTGSGGATRSVPVTVTGTSFMEGATLAVSKTSGSGVSVVSGSVLVKSATKLTATFSVTGAATTGLWDLKVTNPASLGNSGTSGNSALDIKSETTLTVNRVAPATGSTYGGERVTIYGGGFSAGANVDFGTVRAAGTQVVDANTIVTTVPAPTSTSKTAATEVDVKVSNSATTSATLTKGYSHAKDDVTFFVKKTIPVHASTGIVRSLVRACVLLSAPADTTTAKYGPGSSTGAFWFEVDDVNKTSSAVSGGALAFGPNKRWLVFKRSAGNLGAGLRPVISIHHSLESVGGAALTPQRINSTTVDQYDWITHATSTDTTKPSVSSQTTKSDGAGKVSTTTNIVTLFSEEIDPSTITSTNVTLKTGSTTISAALALSDDLKRVTITPQAELATSTTYTVTFGTSVADLSGNGLSSADARNITTGSGTDSAAPTIDKIVIESLPSDLDGSTTYVNSGGTATAFDVYLPRASWKIEVHYSDEGGTGIDETTFSAKASVAVGSSSANTELASNFDVTSTKATWTVPTSKRFATGDNVDFKFKVSDLASTANVSTETKVTFDVVDETSTVVASAGGDHEPFDARHSWILRTDLDHWTATYKDQNADATTTPATPAKRGATTTNSSNGISDFDEALRLIGLNSGSMTNDAAAATNGTRRGTNDIMHGLTIARLREILRERWSIEEDGTRDADSVNIEFLLRGEQGSLTSLPTYSTTNEFNSTNGYSEMSFGGTAAVDTSDFVSFSTLGTAWYDNRNRRHEANLNITAGTDTGIYLLGLLENQVNTFSGAPFDKAVSSKFVKVHGGTPVGEHASDDDVLAGTFARATSTNVTHNTRYDEIMDAIELVALMTSATTAHEAGHSTGLVADGAPKKGLFGAAHENNTFTEATSTSTNTSHHMDFVGQDLMAAKSGILEDTQTGTNFARFNPMIRAYLRNRLVYDEGK